jgi:hypothetical protein
MGLIAMLGLDAIVANIVRPVIEAVIQSGI